MKNYHIKHKKTGEEQFVQSLDGYNAKQWVVTELDREPEHHEIMVDGKLEHQAHLKKRAEAEARFNNMHKGDLMLLIERLSAALGVSTDITKLP